jgi:hypothetical protein
MKIDMQDEIAVIIAKYNSGQPEEQYDCAEEVFSAGLSGIPRR